MKWAVSIDISFEKASKKAVSAAEEELEEKGLRWYSAGTCFESPGSRSIQWRLNTEKLALTVYGIVEEALLWHGIEHTISLEKV